MHALLWTCFLPALLLSTAALSETETISVKELIGKNATLQCIIRTQEEAVLRTWKAVTQTAYPCLISFRHDKNETFVNCSEHITYSTEKDGSATLYVKPVGIIDEGLYIFEASNPTGTFSCHINLEVQVPPEVTLTTDSSGAAVCQAARGKPAANISWEPACEDCKPEYIAHHNRTVTVTSKYRARSENETSAVCIVSHRTFTVPHNLSSALSYQESEIRSTDNLLIWISVTVCFIITALAGLIFYRKSQEIRQCYKFTCGQEASLQRDPHNAEVVEEVEPYASYMQKVNTIYCSITELSPECMPDGSQVELRNYPTKYWN